MKEEVVAKSTSEDVPEEAPEKSIQSKVEDGDKAVGASEAKLEERTENIEEKKPEVKVASGDVVADVVRTIDPIPVPATSFVTN